LEVPKSSLKPSKTWIFKKSILRRLQRAPIIVFFVQNGQLGSVLEAQEVPKSEPNHQKIDAESVMFSRSILEGFGCRFRSVFGKVFGRKMHANCKSVLLAKT